MRRVTRVLVVTLFSMALIPLGTRSAIACSCASPPSDEAAAEEADVVFAGYVIGAEYPNEVRNVDHTLGEIRWTLLPDTLVKGLDAGPVEVLSPSQETACGVSFNVGRRYLVFANDEDGALTTNYCNRTRSFYKDVKLAGVEKVPGAFGAKTRGTEDGSTVFFAAVAGVAAIALIAGAILLLRRRSGRSTA